MNTACSIKMFEHSIEQLRNQPRKVKLDKKRITNVRKKTFFFFSPIKTKPFHMNNKERRKKHKKIFVHLFTFNIQADK